MRKLFLCIIFPQKLMFQRVFQAVGAVFHRAGFCADGIGTAGFCAVTVRAIASLYPTGCSKDQDKQNKFFHGRILS